MVALGWCLTRHHDTCPAIIILSEAATKDIMCDCECHQTEEKK